MEHLLQTLIDNSSLRRGLLFHMEHLQEDKLTLTSLQCPLEPINKLVDELKILVDNDKNPDDNLGEVNKTAGVNDSGTGSTDYLDYTTYAKALVEVTK